MAVKRRHYSDRPLNNITPMGTGYTYDLFGEVDTPQAGSLPEPSNFCYHSNYGYPFRYSFKKALLKPYSCDYPRENPIVKYVWRSYRRGFYQGLVRFLRSC